MMPSRRERFKRRREAFSKHILCVSQHLERNPALGTEGFSLATALLPVFTEEGTRSRSHYVEVCHSKMCEVLHLERETNHGSVL